MSDLGASFMENIQGLMAQCRDLENQHHEKLMEMSIFTLEKVVKNELDDDIPDDLKEVMFSYTNLPKHEWDNMFTIEGTFLCNFSLHIKNNLMNKNGYTKYHILYSKFHDSV